MEEKDIIKIGNYIVIQKQKYFKLHQLNARCDIILGKDKINLKSIVGQPFWTNFKMIPKQKREFDLEVTTVVKSLPDAVMRDISSGNDNRNITDDGKSQLLSTEEIEAFRESGLSAQNIVGKLIESSTTFKNKTEYSQEKYLKKKEKKYFEYIVIRKPTVRLLAHIYFSKDPYNVLGLRHDSIAQILSYANIQSDGTYILFESGTQALLGAGILDCLARDGQLISITTGKFPPKQAILSMNFSEEQTSRFLSVRLADFISSLRGESPSTNCEHEERPQNGHISAQGEELMSSSTGDINTLSQGVAEPVNSEEIPDRTISIGSRKRRLPVDDGSAKRPRWLDTLEKASHLLKTRRADGLILACKEFPLNIIEVLLPYLRQSRSIVVYSVYREPLVQLYVELKKKKEIIGLHIYENWLRNHQVLTDRTHPDVTMSASGGHILIGTKVMCDAT